MGAGEITLRTLPRHLVMGIFVCRLVLDTLARMASFEILPRSRC